jgi:hypothetical protein
MYESPIKIIEDLTRDVTDAFEDHVYQCIIRCGVEVDKEELVKALNYDRHPARWRLHRRQNMLTNDRERRICKKYSAYDEKTNGVRCHVCPLRKGAGYYDFRCKANSHYNRKTREWEYDKYNESADIREIYDS